MEEQVDSLDVVQGKGPFEALHVHGLQFNARVRDNLVLQPPGGPDVEDLRVGFHLLQSFN